MLLHTDASRAMIIIICDRTDTQRLHSTLKLRSDIEWIEVYPHRIVFGYMLNVNTTADSNITPTLQLHKDHTDNHETASCTKINIKAKSSDISLLCSTIRHQKYSYIFVEFDVFSGDALDMNAVVHAGNVVSNISDILVGMKGNSVQ